MLSSLFFRFLRLVITSIICSFPVYLGVSGIMTGKHVLLLSFVVFVIATGIDAYRFSFAFYKIRDYFLGQLLPLVIYIVMAFLTCLAFPPVVFNRIFLPLRFAGCFQMVTIESIAVIGTVFIVMVTILRFIGAKSGYSFHSMHDVSED